MDGVPPTSGGEPSRESRPRGETLSKRHAQPDASTAVAAEPEVGVSGTAARAIGVAPSQRSEAHDTQLDRSTAFLQQRAQRMAAFSLSLGRADAPTAAAGSEVGASDNAARATDVAPSPQALRAAAAQPRPARGSGSRGETEVDYDRETGTHAHEPTLECQPAGEFEPRAEVTSHTQPDTPNAAAEPEVDASGNAARATDTVEQPRSEDKPHVPVATAASTPLALHDVAAQPRPARGSGPRDETPSQRYTQPDTAAAGSDVGASGNAARAPDEAPSTHSDHEPQFATAKLQSVRGAESQPARGSKPRDGTPPKRHPQPDTPTAAAALEVGVHGTAAGATVSTKAQWQRASAKASFLVTVAGHHVHDARVAEAQNFAPTTQGGSGKPPPLKKRQSNDWASEAQAPELALESQPARGSKPRDGTPPKRHPQPDTPTAAAALEVGVHGTAAGATVSTKAQWQRASAKASFLVTVAGHHVHDARVAEAQNFAPTTQGGSGKPPPLKKRQSNDWASEAQAPELALESQPARGSKPRGGTPPKRHPQPDTPAF